MGRNNIYKLFFLQWNLIVLSSLFETSDSSSCGFSTYLFAHTVTLTWHWRHSHTRAQTMQALVPQIPHSSVPFPKDAPVIPSLSISSPAASCIGHLMSINILSLDPHIPVPKPMTPSNEVGCPVNLLHRIVLSHSIFYRQIVNES